MIYPDEGIARNSSSLSHIVAFLDRKVYRQLEQTGIYRILRYQCQSLIGRSLRPGTGEMLESKRSIIRVSILMVKEADSRLIEDFNIGPGLKEPRRQHGLAATMEAVANDQ